MKMLSLDSNLVRELSSNFYVFKTAGNRDLDFMTNSKIYKGFYREKSFGVRLYPESFFTLTSLIDFQTLHRHKIKTTTVRNVKAQS